MPRRRQGIEWKFVDATGGISPRENFIIRRVGAIKAGRSAGATYVDQFQYYGRAGRIVKGTVKGEVFLSVTALRIYVLVSSRKNYKRYVPSSRWFLLFYTPSSLIKLSNIRIANKYIIFSNIQSDSGIMLLILRSEKGKVSIIWKRN